MTGKLLNGFYGICGSLLICFCSSCSDFDSFGSNLLDDDWIHTNNGIDTFKLFASPAKDDSLITFLNSTYINATNFSDAAFPLGKMEEPFFGKAEAGFGTQLRIIATSNLDFLRNTVDSVILSLRYDTSLFYGKYTKLDPMDFSVYPLTETYVATNTYYTTHALQYDAGKKLGGIIGVVPDKIDSIPLLLDVVQYNVYPQLRIPLDTNLFMSLLRAYSDDVYTVVDSFSKVFNGIAVICEKANGFASVLPEHIDSKVTVYYHLNGSIVESTQEFNMGSLAVKTPYYKIDNQNTKAEQCINGSISPDSLLCIQGLTGRDIHLTIPYDGGWEGKFINFAVLKFYADELPGDDLTNYSVPQLLEIFDVSSGTKVAIDDAAYGIAADYTKYIRVFGGNPVETVENGKTMYLYKMNITRHFQKSLRAKQAMDLVISPLLKLHSPARAFFYGPGKSQFSAKLILTYSK